jgi:hypothetical protein
MCVDAAVDAVIEQRASDIIVPKAFSGRICFGMNGSGPVDGTDDGVCDDQTV